LTLPWDEAEKYIRSGHRNPEEFKPESLRTITLSEEEGIKAVVGKPKGKDTMEVQSYLFDKGKGWTLEKAKAWFEQHRESLRVREHVSAILPLKVLEKIVDEPLRIKGIALTAGMSRNFNVYTLEELQAFTGKLVSAPVYVEHVAVPNAVGKVAKAEWDGRNLWYEAEIYDDAVAEKIRKGLIQHVSVGADYEVLDVLDGQVPHGLHNAELSLVAVAGIPQTNIQILEKLHAKEQAAEPQEFIFHILRDYKAFLPEHFRTVWIDQTAGIQGIHGLLRETPGEPQPYALLFFKQQGWTPERVDEWLRAHTQYTQSPTGVSAPQQTPLKERENMSEQNKGLKPKQLQERVWTRRYISQLPDSAFAFVYKDNDRVVRKFPHHDANGRLDPAHVRNANARIPQSDLTAGQKEQAMRHMAKHKEQMGIGMSAEEAKLVEQDKEGGEIEFGVAEEPMMDELIASVEDVVEQISDAIEALTDRIAKLEQPQEPEGEGNVAESLLKKSSEPKIPVSQVVEKLQGIIPPDFILRAWPAGSGGYRLVQELKRVIRELEKNE